MATDSSPDMREDIEAYDVRVERRWPNFYIRSVKECIPPVDVVISVRFMSERSALEFESAVRGMLVPDESS